jgi:predicted enzyme related to lactoylglutathione lyase
MIIHYVNEMDRALRFYRDVIGLEVVEASPGWSTLRCDGCIVALHILAPGMNEAVAAHAGLNLRVDDLEAAVAEVVAGGGHVKRVQEAGGGVPVRIAELSDPEGNGFELRQPVGA